MIKITKKMAKNFLTDINLSQNELLNAVMQNLTTAPQNPKVGQLYYSTTDKIMYQWDGTEWKPVGKVYIHGNGIVISASNEVSADFANESQATAGESTTKVMSPAMVKAVIQTLDVNGFAQGVIAANGSTITIKGLKEEDGKVAADSNNNLVIMIDSLHGYDQTDNPLATVGTVDAAKTASAVTVETGSESATNFVSYTLKQGGTTVGTINIPKFLVLKPGSAVVTGTWDGTAFTEDETQPGNSKGKAIKLVLNDSNDADTTDDVLYINVADLVDAYIAGAGIEISNGNEVKVKMATDTVGPVASETVSVTEGRQYAVVLDANGNLSVNVPWRDTTYTNKQLGQGYATCDTAEATLEKTVSLTGYVLSEGGVVAVRFTNSVPARARLNVNETGEKYMRYDGSTIRADIIQAGDTATFMYDGLYYQLLAVDRVNKAAVTGVTWTAGYHHVVVTFADGTTSNITIHPTNTAYPESGNGAAVPTENKTPGFGSDFDVPQVVTDDFGHVTKQNTRKVTIPSTEATQSAAGLMSAADKKKLDTMAAAAMKQYTRTNPALTATNGLCTWQITDVGDANGSKKNAICSLRDNLGNEVFADVQYTQSAIVIKINSAVNITASTYTAVIIIPETITVS